MESTQATAAALVDRCKHWIQNHSEKGRWPYWEQIEQLIATVGSKKAAVFRVRHFDLPDNLAILLLHRPSEWMVAMKEAVYSLEREVNPEFAEWLKTHLEIEVTGLPPSRRLDKEMWGKFVALGPCQVRRIEPLRHEKVKTSYRCTNCDAVTDARKSGNGLKKPLKCPACGEKELVEDEENTILEDFCHIEVIMAGDNGLVADEGKALTYWLEIRGEKAFEVPDYGETWIVAGTVQISEDQSEQPIGEKTAYFMYLEVNSIEKVATKKESLVQVTPELMAARKKWVEATERAGKDVEQELVAKLMPSIVGEDLLKKSLLRQAVSGAVENIGERTEIHILILKNPGGAKTDLAMYMAELMGGAYVPAEGASAVGLTIGLKNDPKTKNKVAEAGVAVIHNGKPIYLDEVDKLREKWEVLPQLNTPMEKGFFHETKIFNKKFETRSTWAIFGNFKHRTYDPKQSLWWNIDLPSDTLDRCDLWHIDPVTYYDEKTWDSILDAQSDRFEKGKKKIEIDEDLRAHIACARTIREVRFEFGVREEFKKFFQDMKKVEQFMGGGVKITSRQFNGLWRQAIARAVLHLRDTVTVADARAAIKHLTAVLTRVGIDPSTGEVDLGVLTGDNKSRQNRAKLFKTIMASLQGNRHEDVSEEILLKSLASGGFKTDMAARMAFSEAKESLAIQQTRPGYWRLV